MKIKYLFLIILFVAACQNDSEEIPEKENHAPLFTMLSGSETGIDFVNQLDYDADFNIYTYRNFYNGGGVSVGDINHDGLVDLYFTANQKPNRLYLNRGNFQFEDITEKAGVAGSRAWSTGVTMVDVNGDGWLDIYVCNSGDIKGDNKQNELFINNGASATEGVADGVTFTEEAEAFGIADQGYSTHAAFFDYDRDGDLDLYLLNNSYQAIGSFNLQKNERPKRDPVGGDKLFRNDGISTAGSKGGGFTDVSEQAGIYGSIIGFGLGVTVGDVDRDGWQDLYISNDFFERDYLYMNQKDGTFKEALEDHIRSISAASMGADMADIDNDGYPEIFVTEMLPEDDARLKTKTTFENWDRYQYNLKNDYYHQFTRNMFQLNNADGTFSEIGRLAGVHATDWSWGALMADYDNDGDKDLFVANGIHQDLTDQDYIQFFSNEEVVRSILTQDNIDFKELIDAIPSEKVSNYMFVNEGNYQFKNVAADWGLDLPSHSNGAAYADLDNDGDLDLVVNNVNMEAFVYRNESDKLGNDRHYLRVDLEGADRNPDALGAKLTLYTPGGMQYLEQMPTRGFQSSVDFRSHFGLGKETRIDSLIVDWPNGRRSVEKNIAADQVIKLSQSDADRETPPFAKDETIAKVFTDLTGKGLIQYHHRENAFVDFDRDRLIYHKLSTEGPKISKGDVNGDGREDVFIGGAKESPGALMVQQANGRFVATNQELFAADQISEDIGSTFFDADGDGDQDLYVVSGGNEFSTTSSALKDRLYLNDGKGIFSKSPQSLPTKYESGSCVKAADFDGDGDTDLFVGTRLKPFDYGQPVSGYLLANDGKGNFSDVTAKLAPALQKIGMITDALWLDYDQDQDLDLIVIGEWMPIKIFRNDLQSGEDAFTEVGVEAGLAETSGWWHTLRAGDLDRDGDLDLVVTNHGLNSRFKTSPEKPVTMTVNDFDHNGSAEQIITMYQGDEAYPLALRHDLVMQMPGLKKKYLKYENYKEQTLQDMFTPEQLEGAISMDAKTLATSLLVNNGDGTFTIRPLPVRAQFAPMYGLHIEDVDQDGHLDILLGGNFYGAKPEVGRYDASFGVFLRGDGQLNFSYVPSKPSGFFLDGEVRDLLSVKAGQQNLLLVGKCDGEMGVLGY